MKPHQIYNALIHTNLHMPNGEATQLIDQRDFSYLCDQLVKDADVMADLSHEVLDDMLNDNKTLENIKWALVSTRVQNFAAFGTWVGMFGGDFYDRLHKRINAYIAANAEEYLTLAREHSAESERLVRHG